MKEAARRGQLTRHAARVLEPRAHPQKLHCPGQYYHAQFRPPLKINIHIKPLHRLDLSFIKLEIGPSGDQNRVQ